MSDRKAEALRQDLLSRCLQSPAAKLPSRPGRRVWQLDGPAWAIVHLTFPAACKAATNATTRCEQPDSEHNQRYTIRSGDGNCKFHRPVGATGVITCPVVSLTCILLLVGGLPAQFVDTQLTCRAEQRPHHGERQAPPCSTQELAPLMHAQGGARGWAVGAGPARCAFPGGGGLPGVCSRHGSCHAGARAAAAHTVPAVGWAAARLHSAPSSPARYGVCPGH